MSMTDAAKAQLATTIRGLRAYLLGDPANTADRGALHDAVESTYRTAVRPQDAGLSQAAKIRRRRLESWAREQVRADEAAGRKPRAELDYVRDAEKQAAYTLLNRLVVLRLLEGADLRNPAVVTSGLQSKGYEPFRDIAKALTYDVSQGYEFLLRLVFEDLAVDLPGIFGPAGIADLIPVTGPILQRVVNDLNAPGLTSCWTDDMTLGWVYQYWNDPERELIDAKLNAGGKVEPYEIASKTQIFTERYMVDWLLQNSLGPMWLATCRKHGWTPEAESSGTLAALEARRVEWRARRDAGEVSLTELMPLHTDAERRWAYYVPQEIPDDAVTHAPESVRDLKILDPAVGSGHFLVVAFDLLVALYEEEARHRGETEDERWSHRAIVERILEHNLHGIDIDPRAVQIAAAALWLKAQRTCRDAHPRQLNLVASNLRLGSLRDDDPALVELRRDIERETGMPAALTDKIVHALQGADHLGTLLKVDAAVDLAIEAYEAELSRVDLKQIGLYEEAMQSIRETPSRDEVRDRLESFLAKHSGGGDLGLRLRGEQLTAGVRFLRLARESQYDIVVVNPPYQGTAKIVDADYIARTYPDSKTDLYSAFLDRGIQLLRQGGIASQVSMDGWLFSKQFSRLRASLFATCSIRVVADLLWCAFDAMRHNTVAMYSVQRIAPKTIKSVGLVPTPRDEREESLPALARKRSGVLCQVGRNGFRVDDLNCVPGWPLVYWWTTDTIRQFVEKRTVGEIEPVRQGMASSDNVRFLRFPHEIDRIRVAAIKCSVDQYPTASDYWVPYIKGALGKDWFEPVSDVINWRNRGLECKVLAESKYKSYTRSIKNEPYFFQRGVAFAAIGQGFTARLHRYRSVIDVMGQSVFPRDPNEIVCLLNSRVAREIVRDLNPGLHFQVGDVNRLPHVSIPVADLVIRRLEPAFDSIERCTESSIEFVGPGSSTWRSAREWAGALMERADADQFDLPEFEVDLPQPVDWVSWAVGVALGRFQLSSSYVESSSGVDQVPAITGILFLDGTLDDQEDTDGLGDDAAKCLQNEWAVYGASIDKDNSLREYLRLKFFKGVHQDRYKGRPIYFPLSSEKKTFVVFVNIHKWRLDTLQVLQADYLNPKLLRLEGELSDLRSAIAKANAIGAGALQKQYALRLRWRDELKAFIELVEQCAEKGPPDIPGIKPREVDARYVPDLDDGVMINSAALWPLLEPQWKDPKKWWKELATASGKKDYDWSHLAMRYWPDRVDEKCRKDPSLGVAHGCFWKYHPARAWAWELRLQFEIGPDFRIVEGSYRGDGGDAEHRADFLRNHAEDAIAAVEREALRRRRKQNLAQPELHILEPGLWSEAPDRCWAMELRVVEKQDADFRLVSPDEPEARAAFETANPDRVVARAALLESFAEQGTLHETEAEPDEPDADEDDDAEEEADE